MQAGPTQGAYISGKKGMDALLRVLAKEIGMHGITVNQVAPGWTISERDRTAGTGGRSSFVVVRCPGDHRAATYPAVAGLRRVGCRARRD